MSLSLAIPLCECSVSAWTAAQTAWFAVFFNALGVSEGATTLRGLTGWKDICSYQPSTETNALKLPLRENSAHHDGNARAKKWQRCKLVSTRQIWIWRLDVAERRSETVRGKNCQLRDFRPVYRWGLDFFSTHSQSKQRFFPATAWLRYLRSFLMKTSWKKSGRKRGATVVHGIKIIYWDDGDWRELGPMTISVDLGKRTLAGDKNIETWWHQS